MMYSIVIISLALGVCLPASTGLETTIKWNDVSTPSEAFLYHLEPVGKEKEIPLYLCRVNFNEYLVPGKLFINDTFNYCVITSSGEEYAYKQFQVLTAPPGTISWIASINGEIPDNAIPVGVHSEGYTLYMCRIWHSSEVLSVGRMDNRGNCVYGLDWKQFIKAGDIDILVINKYGVAIGARLTED